MAMYVDTRPVGNTPCLAARFFTSRSSLRQCILGIITITVLSSKLLHLYAHFDLFVANNGYEIWLPTFLSQDLAIILVARLLTQERPWTVLQVLLSLITLFFSLVLLALASANTSFYLTTGSIIHWQHASEFHFDPEGVTTLMYGFEGFACAALSMFFIGWLIGPWVYQLTGMFINLVLSSASLLLGKLLPTRWSAHLYVSNDFLGDRPSRYMHLDHQDEEMLQLKSPFRETMVVERFEDNNKPWKKRLTLGVFVIWAILTLVRPWWATFTFLSWTLPLQPIVDRLSGKDSTYFDAFATNGNTQWEDVTSLHPAPVFDWLPEEQLQGFEDYYPESGQLHYSSAEDQLKISNLEENLLEPLEKMLRRHKVDIKHVILVKLESTRKDVFPLKRGSSLWNYLKDTYPDGRLPPRVEEQLSNLTQTAQYLTGERDGFESSTTKTKSRGKAGRGGISALNGQTMSTYTVKSLVGTLCGLTPLVTDFNREYNHHIYQPCIAQVMEAFNSQITSKSKLAASRDYKTWPWKSTWMQSVTGGYDNQDLLMNAMGYRNESIITSETLEMPNATHGPLASQPVNYYGYVETELRPYLRDAIRKAEKEHHRLFLTHLTGTTHHPYGLPGGEFTEFTGPDWHGEDNNLSRYLSTVGFVDRWLAELLAMLEEEKVADSTLVVLVGDHGLSLAENGGITPFDNPHVKNFHVPIVFSHPRLPPLHVEAPVQSSQILPTLLDLLLTTQSLSTDSAAVARDLLPTYEGQSLLRRLKAESDDGEPDWQFSVANPGGSWLLVRSATQPFRMVVPLSADYPWQFMDPVADPREQRPLKDFDPWQLVRKVKAEHGPEAAQWMKDAAHAARWWLRENRARWRYTDGNRGESTS